MKWNAKKLTKIELKEILSIQEYELEEEITNFMFPIEAVQLLKGGEVIIITDTGGMMYKSKSEVLRIINSTKNYSIPDPDPQFHKKIDTYIKELNLLTSLSLSSTDRLTKLVELDSSLKKIGIGLISRNMEEYLLPIVAYCGQIICNQTNGYWSIEKINNKTSVFIIGQNGKKYDPYNCVLKEIANQGEDTFCLDAIIEYEINPISLD